MHIYGAHTLEVCPMKDSDQIQVVPGANSERSRILTDQSHSHLKALQQVAQCSGDTAMVCMQTQNPKFPAHPLHSYIAALQSDAQLQCEVRTKSEATSAEELDRLK